jgi:hypothetical protein
MGVSVGIKVTVGDGIGVAAGVGTAQADSQIPNRAGSIQVLIRMAIPSAGSI